MNRKRGKVLVLIVLVLFLVIVSESVLGWTKYTALESDVGQADDCDEWSSEEKVDNFQIAEGWHAYGCKDSTGDNFYWVTFPMGSGCIYVVSEYDNWGDDDDCGHVGIKESEIVSNRGRRLSHYGNFRNNEEDSDEWRLGFDECPPESPTIWKSENNKEYICANDQYWYECNERDENKYISITKEGEETSSRFFCANVNEVMQWLSEEDFTSKMDNDEDGVPPPWDCDDNDGEVYGAFFDAPAHPEICGDKKNNDCLGGSAKQNLEAEGDLGDSSDNCDENKDACENNCLKRGQESGEGHCSWLINAERVENRCCGDDGIEDLGRKGTAEEGNYLCLKDAKELVGYEGDGFPGVECNDNEWCWVSAWRNAAFHIFTIKKPGETAYDVVSNSVDWVECKDGEGTKEMSSGIIGPDYIKEANRFYCYQEGERWSWADCGEAVENGINGIKNRGKGDGLFALRTTASTEPQSSILIDFTGYESFYKDLRFDITGYDNLEFMMKFSDEITLPAEIVLTIFGPKKRGEQGYEIYFNQNVLAYGTNPLIEKGKWIPIKVPIPEMRGVEGIKIDSIPEANKIEVQHVYLSKSDKPQLCSGKTSTTPGNSAWLDNLDFWEGGKISGENICNALYDPEEGKAWLGDEEVTIDERRCCGNDPDEYYSGSSKHNYGCWNSQVIGSRDTVMNVEFEVAYKEEEKQVQYNPLPFGYKVVGNYRREISVMGIGVEDLKTENYLFDDETISIEEDYKKSIFDLGMRNVIEVLSLEYNLFRFELVYNNPDVDIHFFNAVTRENLGNEVTEENLRHGLDNIFVVAETDLINVSVIDSTVDKGPEVFAYTCPQEAGECLYPLPGFSPYNITNSHPGLYELWFVSKDDNVLVTNAPEQSFDEPGNLKAKKVPQQVIFINEGEGAEEEPGFYGCQAASYLEPYLGEGNNLPYCSIKGDKFCAHQEGDMVNSWSDEGLTRWGYQEGASEEMEFGLEEGEEEKVATERNWSSTVVPGRNFVSNAEFTEFDGQDLLNWETFKRETLPFKRETIPIRLPQKVAAQEVRIENEKSYLTIEEGVLTLQTDDRLKSEKIAVEKEKDLTLSYWQDGTCGAKIYLVDKDGNEETKNVVTILYTFNTGDASHIILEFTGACQIKQPMLQLVDELGAADYSYKTEETERAGAACCPENYCWNGYVCVRDMSPFTYMTEKVEEGRFYRCIEGEWRYLPIQWDWDFENFGFCQEKEQCFVLEEGDPGAEPEDVYQNAKFPICVNDGEFIFDHYCEKGNWTSRTKLLALSLLEAYEDENYVLYCTNPLDSLVEFENKENNLGISFETEQGEELLTAEERKYQGTCFDETMDFGRLIKSEENTCINNVCVLKTEDGLFFASSLNNNRAMEALGIPANSLGEICEEGERFVECDLSAVGVEGKLWYISEIKGWIYIKERDWWDALPDLISDPFDFGVTRLETEDLSEAGKFVKEGINFNELYLLNKEDKKVKAIREKFSDGQILTAEYEGFSTPVCEYVNSNRVETPTEMPLIGEAKVTCEIKNGKQRVIISRDLNFWWPQLTGKLRVS